MSCCILLIPAGILAVLAARTGWKILRQAQGTEGTFRWLLVLGTHVHSTEPTAMLSARIEAAAAYLKAHPQVRCVVSGYRGPKSTISEAACMFRELTALGVEPDRILQETQAASTMENLELSLALIEKRTGCRPERLGILSSEFHLLRARMCAGHLGAEAVLLPAKTWHKPTFLLYFFREILAVWYYSIFYSRRIST